MSSTVALLRGFEVLVCFINLQKMKQPPVCFWGHQTLQHVGTPRDSSGFWGARSAMRGVKRGVLGTARPHLTSFAGSATLSEMPRDQFCHGRNRS